MHVQCGNEHKNINTRVTNTPLLPVFGKSISFCLSNPLLLKAAKKKKSGLILQMDPAVIGGVWHKAAV